ncbi:hypothetical protein VKT23_020334 [Stygiomarasmius scandens]|uniref:3'-5' exonuclease domain-containing protein n=1 Tax=Marasmiellus scandens TaxID=2682957 RepID=A0ABR1IL88_9AGAR
MSSNRVDIAALLARLSLPADNPPKDSKFTLCSDPDSVKEAVDALSSCSTIILDCEALSLGNQGGTLSLISLRTTPVSSARTFIIDAVALSSEELQPILDLIQSNAIQKVVFDGRMDYCAFYFEYNTRIQNVIDLQLADIQSRTLRGEATISQRNRLIGYLLRSEVNGRRKGRYEQIHVLAGIARCLRDHDLQVQDKSVLDHSRWLERPLPPLYLSYAAHDVYIIGIIYNHFLQKNYLGKSLAAQSARYASIWENSQPREGDVYRRNPLLPLEILSTNSSLTQHTRVCSGCERSLTDRSFDGNGTKCWVCMAVDVSEGSKTERAKFRRVNPGRRY